MSEPLDLGIRSVQLVLLVEKLVVYALGERVERAVFLFELGAEGGAVTFGDDELVGEPALAVKVSSTLHMRTASRDS